MYFQYYIFCIGNCITVTDVSGLGKYFYFLESDIMARFGKIGNTYDVVQRRGGAIIQTAVSVLILTTQGRYNPSSVASAGDWQIGDKFCRGT